MSDVRLNALSRRLDRVEQFLERQGFERRIDHGSFLAEMEAEDQRMRKNVATPESPPPAPPSVPPPMPTAPPVPIAAAAVPTWDEVDDRGVPIATETIAIGPEMIEPTPYERPARGQLAHLPPPMPATANPDAPGSAGFAPPPKADVQTRGFARDDRTVQTGGFEQLVGLKLAGWVGAIVLVIGAALGVKFAYDQGWLGGLPNSVRLGLLYALGFAVVGAGEWVYRRVGDVASAGVFGAGVAILFVVGYAGDAYFNLYGQGVAFSLMAGASAIGALVAWRAQLVSIAVLSILGANLAPVLLGRSAAGESTLLVYLLALQVLALLLAHVGRGDRWWALRSVSLATTAVWVAVRLATPTTMRSEPTVFFTIAYALIFQIEAALAARRAAWTWAQRHASFSAFSMTVTLLLTLAVFVWTDPWPDAQVGATLLGMAMTLIVAGAAGIAGGAKRLHAGAERSAAPDQLDDAEDPGRREYALPRRVGSVEDAGRAFRELAVSWLGQGMTLVAVAAAAAFDGPALLVAWLATGLVYAAIGVYARRPATVVGGVVVWSLAVAHLAIFSFYDLNRAVVVSVGGVPISQALVAGVALWAAGLAIAAALASRRLDAPTGRFGRLAEPLGNAMPTIATLVAACTIYAALPPLAATVGLALLAWATLAAARVPALGGNVAALAVCVAAVALAKWFAIDVLSTRLDGRPLEGRAIFNATFAVGAVVAAMGVALVWLRGAGSPSVEASASPAEVGQAGMPVLREARVAAIQVERLLAVGVAIGALAIALCVEFGPAARAYNAGRAVQVFPTSQLMLLAQTALLTLVALAAAPVGRAIAPLAVDADRARRACGWAIAALAAKFIVGDSLAWIGDDLFRAPSAFINVQAAVAAIAVVACVIVARRNGAARVAKVAGAMAAIVPLVAGSIELARAVGPERTLVALSIFWAAYAAAAIAVGFALRGGFGLRVGGLALLAVTIAKVVLVDLASAGTGWRILSFLAVGALLLATSVLYGKFGQQLLRRDDERTPGFEVDR